MCRMSFTCQKQWRPLRFVSLFHVSISGVSVSCMLHVKISGDQCVVYHYSVSGSVGVNALCVCYMLGSEDNIKMDLKRSGMGVRTGSMWLRIGTGGGLL